MNRPQRVLVTGAHGQVGVDLVDYLSGRLPLGGRADFAPDQRPLDDQEFEVVGLSHHELDVSSPEQVERALASARPDVIVHLAAYTAVDRAETEPEAARAVNTDGTGLLSEGAARYGAHLVTVSTDYVFNGRKGSSYVEDDETDPVSVYGLTKRDGEWRCSLADTVVRTSWVMGVRGKNVAHVIADRARSGQGVRFVSDQIGTVTSAADLARTLVAMVRTQPGGVWHVANTGTTTWYEIAAYIGEILGRGADFATPITSDQLSPTPLATRPPRSDLDTTKFAAAYEALPEWRDALARLVRDRDLLPR